MDTHDKSHHRTMTSQEWRTLIEDIAAEIHAKETRLAAIGSAKAAVIVTGDSKKLLLLEAEEMELPGLIEQLKKRLPLLAHAHEGALKSEAEERYQELALQGAEAAAAVTEATKKIRDTMQSLLACISEAHTAWNAHGLLRAEAEYLKLRFALSSREVPAGDRLTPEEHHRFVSQYQLLLRHSPPTHPWGTLLSEWQAEQRRAEEDASRRPQPYKYLQKTYP